VSPFVDHVLAIDEYVPNAVGILMRVLKRCPVLHGGWIEYDNIRIVGRLDESSILYAEIRGRQ
jgi:hypothetical protein